MRKTGWALIAPVRRQGRCVRPRGVLRQLMVRELLSQRFDFFFEFQLLTLHR